MIDKTVSSIRDAVAGIFDRATIMIGGFGTAGMPEQLIDGLTKDGESKLVEQCTYPLTGLRCVSRVYSDMAIFDLTPQGAIVVEMVDGLTFEELKRLTRVPLQATPGLENQS